MTTPPDPYQTRARETPADAGPVGPGAVAHRDARDVSDTDPVAAVYGAPPEGGTRTAAAAARALARRPAEAWIGAVFLTLAALPAAALGLLLGLQPGNIGTNLRARIDAAHSTVSTDTLLTVFRLAGLVVLVLAVLFVLFAWLAVRPKQGARSVAAGLAALEVVLVLAGMVVAGVDAVSVGVVLLAVAGTVLLYLPKTTEFLAARR